MTINLYQTYNNIIEYEDNNYKKKQVELKIIVNDMNKIADVIFENLINTKSVIKIFKNAHGTEDIEKDKIRDDLYRLLNDKYKRKN